MESEPPPRLFCFLSRSSLLCAHHLLLTEMSGHSEKLGENGDCFQRCASLLERERHWEGKEGEKEEGWKEEVGRGIYLADFHPPIWHIGTKCKARFLIRHMSGLSQNSESYKYVEHMLMILEWLLTNYMLWALIPFLSAIDHRCHFWSDGHQWQRDREFLRL